MAIAYTRIPEQWNTARVPRGNPQERITNGLGWFSIGLGLAEVVAPRRVARMIGVRDEDGTRNLLRFYGFREIAAGAGILSQPRPAGWIWGRVAGDLMDLASLASAMKSNDVDRSKMVKATAAVLGVTALDVICAQRLSASSPSEGEAQDRSVKIANSITVGCSPEEAYRRWRSFEDLPSFLQRLESVQVTGDNRVRLKAKTLTGMVEWDAEITEDRANERIAWRAVEGAPARCSGAIGFRSAPGGRGTIVRAEIQFEPRGGTIGAIGASVARLFGKKLGLLIEEDLRAFKQIIEVGEIVKSDASIHRGMHAARPPMDAELAGARI